MTQRGRARHRAFAGRPDGMARRAPALHERSPPRRRGEVHSRFGIVFRRVSRASSFAIFGTSCASHQHQHGGNRDQPQDALHTAHSTSLILDEAPGIDFDQCHRGAPVGPSMLVGSGNPVKNVVLTGTQTPPSVQDSPDPEDLVRALVERGSTSCVGSILNRPAKVERPSPPRRRTLHGADEPNRFRHSSWAQHRWPARRHPPT